MAPVYDAQTSFRNGANFNDTDTLVGAGYISGVNVRPLGDDLVERYPVKQLDLNLDVDSFVGEISYQTLIDFGNPQALIPMDGYLIYIVNGRIFKITLADFCITEIKYEGSAVPISDRCQIVNWTKVNEALIIYDGDLPLFYEGAGTVRRSDLARTYNFTDASGELVSIATPELIRGSIGFYNQLRVWQGISTNTLAVSDILGEFPGAPFTMQSSFTDSGEYTGQFPTLTATTTDQEITAMGQFISPNTVAGFGELFAATDEQIYVVNSLLPRSQWETSQGFISTLLPGKGIAGNLAWDNLNYDLGFISPDGRVNSLFFSNEELKRWSTTSIDREVDNYIKTYSPELYRYSSFEKFQSVALATSFPYYTERLDLQGNGVNSFAFNGFLALSLENLSGLNQEARPVWAGLWTGVKPIFTAEVGDKLYILSDDNGKNEFYVMEAKRGCDEYKGEQRPIRSNVVFGNFGFQEQDLFSKEFESIDITVEDIKDPFRLKAEFKSAESDIWTTIGSESFEKSTCVNGVLGGIMSNRKASLSSHRFVLDKAECSFSPRFKLADIRLIFEGSFRLKHFRLKAEPLMDNDSLEFNSEEIFNREEPCHYIDDYNFYTVFDSKEERLADEKTWSESSCSACNK